jgi:lipoate---protein ligase
MINLIHEKNLNILYQLKLEEFLLKNSNESYCLINEGSSPAIVLGINNNFNEFLNISNVKKDNIPLIKRFTGGGTVFVDESTIFITFIFSKDILKIDLFPEAIIRWAESFYKKVINLNNFRANENDFVIGEKKIAGNAKYIKKDRFLLHTSFLLDFKIEKMTSYLLIPQKAPKYRKSRDHLDFLSPLKSFFSKDSFIDKIKKELQTIFKINHFDYSSIDINKYESTTKIIDF